MQVSKLESELAVAEQKLQEGEQLRRKLHNTIQASVMLCC